MNLQINKLLVLKLISITFITIIYSKNIICSEINIIFKINEKAFTTLDYENRLKYLDFVGNNENLDQDTIIDDLISVNLFFEYSKKMNKKYKFENKANEIYENILSVNSQNNKIYKYKINKANILSNIKLDLVRKTILENILNSNFENIYKTNEELDLLYKFKLSYINFNTNENIDIINKIEELEIKNTQNIKFILNQNKINFHFKEKEINNINKLDFRISKKILSGENFFIIQNKRMSSIILIQKEFETLEGLIANIYSLKSAEEIEKKYLECNNLINNEDNFNLINKEYEYSSLNNKLKNSLININDYVKIINNDEYIYIILCDIKFDKNILQNVNLNKLINKNVSDIEKRFISKYSKIYNLIKN